MKIDQYIKKNLLKIKQTKIWYYFMRFFFIPLFDFIWVNVINFEGRLLAIFYNFKKKNFYKIDKHESVKLIENDADFQKIANRVKSAIDDRLINQLKNGLANIKTNDSSKKQFNDYRKDFFPLLSDEIKDEVVKFALSEKNLLTATKYLKVLPVVKKIIVYINVPTSVKEQGAQLWHKDDFGYKSLDIFLAISDVDMSNGPLYFLKTKNPLGVFFKIKDVIKNAKPGERNKVSIDKFSEHYSDSEIGALIGKSGTGVLIDSFTKYHRGGFCKTKDRIMLRISYQTPDSSRGNNSHNNEKFFYHPKILKNDVKNIFHKYVMFKNRNKFVNLIKIDNIILFLIRIFHYKI